MIAVVGSGVMDDLPDALQVQTQEEVVYWPDYEAVDLSQKLDGAVVAHLIFGPRSDFAWTARHTIEQLRRHNSGATIVAVVNVELHDPQDYIRAGATHTISYESMQALTPLVRLLKP